MAVLGHLVLDHWVPGHQKIVWGESRQESSGSGTAAKKQVSDEGDGVGARPVVYAVVEGTSIGPAEVLFLLEELSPASGQQKEQLRKWLQSTSEMESPEIRIKAIPVQVREAAVEQWIERRLVLSYLRAAGYVPGESQLDSKWKEQCREALARGEDLPAELEQRGITVQLYLDHLAWQQGWADFLRAKVNQDSLKKYFELRRDRFDGTQLRVAQIFLPYGMAAEGPTAQNNFNGDPSTHGADLADEKAKCLELGEHLFNQIQNKTLSFEEAALKFSRGSTALEGGELGWIDFDGPLLPVVTDAAFNTAVGNVSRPVVSSMGVHLIKVSERKRGKITFDERMDRIRVSAVTDLWNNLVKQQRKRVSVNLYTPDDH